MFTQRHSKSCDGCEPKLMTCIVFQIAQPVANSGFPRVGGANPQGILPNFPKNCMKLKEFGPRGGRGVTSLAPHLDPPIITKLKLQTPHCNPTRLEYLGLIELLHSCSTSRYSTVIVQQRHHHSTRG